MFSATKTLWIPLSLACLLALGGCNPLASSNDDDDSLTSSEKIELGKSFMNSYITLHDSLDDFRAPAETFLNDVEAGISDIPDAEAEGLFLAASVVISQIADHLNSGLDEEPPVWNDTEGDEAVLFANDDNVEFEENSGYRIANGIVTATGTATVDLGDGDSINVPFEIDLTLPNLVSSSPVLAVRTMTFGNANDTVYWTAGQTSLTLSLPNDKTLADEIYETDITGLSFTLANSTLKMGSLSLVANDLEFSFSDITRDNNEYINGVQLSVTADAQLQTSDNSYYQVKMAFVIDYSSEYTNDTDANTEHWVFVVAASEYSFSVRIQANADDFVTLTTTGTVYFNGSEDVDDYATLKDDITLDWTVTLTHNDTSFGLLFSVELISEYIPQFSEICFEGSCSDTFDGQEHTMEYDLAITGTGEHSKVALMFIDDAAQLESGNVAKLRADGADVATLKWRDETDELVAVFTDNTEMVVFAF